MTKNEAVQVNLIYLIFKLVHFLVDTSDDETSKTSLPPDCRPRIRLLQAIGTADGGRCGTADRQHRGGDQCGHPTPRHH